MKVLLAFVIACVAVVGICAGSVQSRDDSIFPPDLIEDVEDWLSEENLECLLAAIDVASKIDISFIDWATQLASTVINLVHRRQACLDMLGDPPRPWEIAASEACMVGWRISAIAELTRFLSSMRESVELAQKFIDALIVGFTDCHNTM